jgi:hypothetical protein
MHFNKPALIIRAALLLALAAITPDSRPFWPSSIDNLLTSWNIPRMIKNELNSYLQST